MTEAGEKLVQARCWLSQAKFDLANRTRPKETVIQAMLDNNKRYGDGLMTPADASRIYESQEAEAVRLGATEQAARQSIEHWTAEIERLEKY